MVSFYTLTYCTTLLQEPPPPSHAIGRQHLKKDKQKYFTETKDIQNKTNVTNKIIFYNTKKILETKKNTKTNFRNKIQRTKTNYINKTKQKLFLQNKTRKQKTIKCTKF